MLLNNIIRNLMKRKWIQEFPCKSSVLKIAIKFKECSSDSRNDIPKEGCERKFYKIPHLFQRNFLVFSIANFPSKFSGPAKISRKNNGFKTTCGVKQRRALKHGARAKSRKQFKWAGKNYVFYLSKYPFSEERLELNKTDVYGIFY